MNYRREFEKALKQYFLPLGYKYVAKRYSFEKKLNDDITQIIIVTDETRFQPRYFWLSILVIVESKKLCSIISELSEGKKSSSVHLFFETVPRRDDPHVEISGERSMEENMLMFDEHVNKYVFPLFDRFPDANSIISYHLGEKMNNENARDWESNRDYYTYPLAFFLSGQNDRCIQRLREIQEKLDRQHNLHPNNSLVNDELDWFVPFKKNLTEWVKYGKEISI